MSKYKIVGVLNILSGVVVVFYSLITIFIIVPKMSQLYDQFDTQSISLIPAYISSALMFLFSTVNIFVAWKLFSKVDDSRESYLKKGVILLAISFILLGVFTYTIVYTTISPIYSLSTTL